MFAPSVRNEGPAERGQMLPQEELIDVEELWSVSLWFMEELSKGRL